MKASKWLAAAICGLIVITLLLLWDRGAERKDFRISSRDGSCVLEGVMKKRWFKTGKTGWWFTDSEEEWVGAQAWIVAGSGRYPLPRDVAGKIANIDSVDVTLCRHEGSCLEVILVGGGGYATTSVTLVFERGRLNFAKADWADYP